MYKEIIKITTCKNLSLCEHMALWFSMNGQNKDATKCFPSDYISSCDTGKRKMLSSHCLQDIIPFLNFLCEPLVDTLNETDEPAAIK
jgi:hypothetical protein